MSQDDEEGSDGDGVDEVFGALMMDPGNEANEEHQQQHPQETAFKKTRTASPKKALNAPKTKTSSSQHSFSSTATTTATTTTQTSKPSKHTSPVKGGAQVKKPASSPTKMKKK